MGTSVFKSSFIVRLLGERSDRIEIEQGQVVAVGRTAECGLRIEEALVSRRHCELEGSADGLIVRDLGSRNGTGLNGRAIDGQAVARPGDQIRVGGAYILVERQAIRRVERPAARRELARAAPGLPGYEVLGQLGEGATGFVYRARRESDGEEVAVKLFRPSRAASPERFVRAAKVLQRLDHPNIVTVHDVVSEGAYHFFTMEVLQGETLEEQTRDQPLGSREALSVGVQIARALKMIHREGLIHRDISPRHIMMLHGGLVKLLGFDFVKKTRSSTATFTRRGDLIGQLTYISPEQARDPRAAEPRSDLYGLGASLFHAITGLPPFAEGDKAQVFRDVVGKDAPRLRDLVGPAASEPADEVVARLLSKDPDERFEDAETAELALEGALLEVCPPDPKPRFPVAAPDEAPARPRSKLTSTDTGMPVAAEGPATFGGGFTGLELLEIVQFLEVKGRDGLLVVEAPDVTGEMFLRGGTIVGAQTDDGGAGEGAARRLLRSHEGTFRFYARPPGAGPVESEAIRLRPSVVAIQEMRDRDEEGRRLARGE